MNESPKRAELASYYTVRGVMRGERSDLMWTSMIEFVLSRLILRGSVWTAVSKIPIIGCLKNATFPFSSLSRET
jgi:hypothetical protein